MKVSECSLAPSMSEHMAPLWASEGFLSMNQGIYLSSDMSQCIILASFAYESMNELGSDMSQ